MKTGSASGIPRTLSVHALILALATAAALWVWLRDRTPGASARHDVVVWRGRANDIDRIELKAAKKTVVLEGKSDAAGRYWLGTATSGHENEAPDAGAPGSAEPSRFVSVGPAGKVADKLGDLRALRDLGRVADDKAAELASGTL